MKDIRKVLIVGSYGSFIENIINKFSREEWRIFTLVSDKFSIKPARVFEQYNFDYSSNSITEIIESCSPEVVLYTGAYDPLYQWEEKTQKADSRKFMSGLSNLLLCSKENNIKHFVFISSEIVFEDPVTCNIPDDAQLTPLSYKGITVAQGEKLVLSFSQMTSMEINIVRLGSVYFTPKNEKECYNISQMCLQALFSDTLKINSTKVTSPLYINDAVHALFLLINAPERKYQVYNASSEVGVSEYEIARAIKKTSLHSFEIEDQSTGIRKQIVLSNQRLFKEFNFEARYSYSDVIPDIIHKMWSNRNHFKSYKRSKSNTSTTVKETLKKVMPFLECLILFFVFSLLKSVGSQIAIIQDVDFCLLLILLFASIYGRQLAIFAFALSVAGYYYQQLLTPNGFQMLIDVKTDIWIAELFIVGISAGQMKDRLAQLGEEKNREIKYLSERIEEISSINNSNVKLKNYFEERIINSNESIGWFYDVITKLDSAEIGEEMFVVVETLSKFMGTKDVAIYSVSDYNYCHLITSMSQRSRSLGKSVRISKYPSLFDTLENKDIFINRTMNLELPSLASALIDPSGKMTFVFLLWDMPYDKMTLYYVNTLKVLCKLIYNSVSRSQKYLDALAHKRYIDNTHILHKFAFEEMCIIYQQANKRRLTEIYLLEVEINEKPLDEWNKKLGNLLRPLDIIGVLSDKKLGILLTNTNEDEAKFVIKKLEKEGILANIMSEDVKMFKIQK